MDDEIDRELGKIAKELIACSAAANQDDEALLIDRLKAMGKRVFKLHDSLKVRRFFEGNGGNHR